ncbi:MAG: AtpZ/AtpI family protein [Candidatus Binatia bacterium]
MKETPPKKGDPFILALGVYGGVGFQLAASVVGGLLIGHYLDKRWDTSPWLAMTGLVIGSAGGFYNLLKILDWNQRRRKSK